MLKIYKKKHLIKYKLQKYLNQKYKNRKTLKIKEIYDLFDFKSSRV